MREVQRAASRRHEEELRIDDEHDQGIKEADRLLATRRSELDERFAEQHSEAEGEHQAVRNDLVQAYESKRTEAQGEYHSVRREATSHAAKTTQQAEAERKEEAWQVLTLYDATKDRPREKLAEAMQRLTIRRKELGVVGRDVLEIAHSRGYSAASLSSSEKRSRAEKSEQPQVTSEAVSDTQCEQALDEVDSLVDEAHSAAVSFYEQKLARLVDGPIPAGAFFGFMTVSVPLFGFLLGWIHWGTWGAPLVLGIVCAVVASLLTKPLAKKQTTETFDSLSTLLLDADKKLRDATALLTQRAEVEAIELITKRDAELEALGFHYDQLIEEAEARSQGRLSEAQQRFPSMLATLRLQHEEQIAQLDTQHEARIVEINRQRDAGLAEAQAEHAEQLSRNEEQRELAWQAMFERWVTEFDNVRAELRDLQSECRRLFPDFTTTDYDQWNKPTEVPASIAFGETTIDLALIKNGLSDDERLTPPQTRLETPTLMTLDEHPTMLVTASGEGRAHGVELLRSMMLRFLTAMPPGKVRFTILDPVGLGDNFQSFMHLADSDEQLIAGRIWSEPSDIEQQLARLTNHMETVLQKYLRSEYETIHEYNAQAGEVAEPFQVLVIAGFPANISETAARRLVSLVTGGPRCGIYTLIGVDLDARMPSDFRLDEIKTNALWLDWDSKLEGLVWRYPAFEHLPMNLAYAPPAERMIDTLRKAGEAAKAAVKVEVPFSVVAPEEEGLWTKTCADELSVPIGRAGANRLQHVRLGKGTSQHLLVAGKTGSGKSTFLHALVTSAAMHFSPKEVEFYLVDFKKGVEFKSYATHRLPHAKVIAIESEREFGLSVLERLDDELKTRGENFRAVGVQNLADYRAARPNESTPRVLLIVDEFQELFVEDDKLAQESALLLDRLVRQGRAFGIHVLLGTQTLAGAYSIARSTLGQMAIRVALECSEADAHLILSDERNTAARFLSRPGEAIYNAQNGLVSANEPFQVVWLPDSERSMRLDALDELRHRRELPRPNAIVFEGSAPADPLTNISLVELIEGDLQQAPPAARAWFGAAVAIKPPTYADFGRHPGANLLVVGPQEPSALGVLTTAAISLLVGERAYGSAARLVVLDATRPGEPSEGVWREVVDCVPGEASYVDTTGATAAVAELAAEVARREGLGQGERPDPIYLVLHNAGRFRELRRSEDDFSFSTKDEPPKPDKQLTEILRNGPAVGVHGLVWCDSYNSVQRMFDRQTLREFAMRIALQMSAADSSNLIDSPAASDLKIHRALFYNDETGQTEKFRPYGAPSAEWLKRVAGTTSASV